MRATFAFSAGTLMLTIGVANAQHHHAAPDPAAPTTGATTATTAPSGSGTSTLLRFDSVLSRYKPMSDQKLSTWREANDTVTRIGGWRTYLKESQSPDTVVPTIPSAAPRPATPKPPTAPDPHAGHGVKP
jgi:hypothetical protein